MMILSLSVTFCHLLSHTRPQHLAAAPGAWPCACGDRAQLREQTPDARPGLRGCFPAMSQQGLLTQT